MKTPDWIGLLEASYTLEVEDAAWRRLVLERSEPLLRRGLAAVMQVVRVTPTRIEFEAVEALGPPEVLGEVAATAAAASPASLAAVYRAGPRIGSLSEMLFAHDEAARRSFLKATAGRVQDTLGVLGHTGTGFAVALLSSHVEPVVATPLERRRWQCAIAHVAAGLRLRKTLEQLQPDAPEAEATLDAAGRVQHATGRARGASAREALRDAVRRIERARTRAGRSDPDASLEGWRGLVAGTWSLVDRFDSDGKRLVVAIRNDPQHRDPRGLSRGERQVAEYLGLGHSTKEIAYALGLSLSAVSMRARSAWQKLGLRSRTELAAFFSAAGPRRRIEEVAIAGERLLVGAFPLLDGELVDRLSPTEQAVAALALSGCTNAEIARRRGTSERTVANQMASLLRKLGVASRVELAARLQGPSAPDD